jgi:uncharacterized protein
MLTLPFSEATALHAVRLAEDVWNARDPERVALGYAAESESRRRVEVLEGRESTRAFLHHKWQRELDYRLVRELWSFTSDRIAIRFAAEWCDASGAWYRTSGHEICEFDDDGMMRRRLACVCDTPIATSDRKLFWPLGKRPDDHPSLTELGL